MGCAGARRTEARARQRAEIESRWGVEVVALRPSAAGRIIDFRYRVIDPAKAAPLVDRTVDAYLVDERRGVTLGVPAGKVGPLRQTLRSGQPPAGRVLFVLFSNPGGLIQSGDRVTVVMGDFKAKDLRVQ
jgi:hypothetical protein